MNFRLKLFFVIGMVMPYAAGADELVNNSVPIISLENIEPTPYSSVKLEINDDLLAFSQQLSVLSQQLENIQQQHFTQKIDEVKQELRYLRGIIDVQSYDISLLKKRAAIGDNATNSKVVNAIAVDNNINKLTTASTDDTNSELLSYDSAFKYLKDRDYEKSATLFKEFLLQYPVGKYVPNANYWLGEIYLLKGEYSLAKNHFNTVINGYYNNSKVPDSMLKLAMVFVNTQQIAAAKAMVTRLEKEFPNSAASRMAKIQFGSL